jgi:hypothetical protein
MKRNTLMDASMLSAALCMVLGCSGDKDKIAGSPAAPGVKSYSVKPEIPTKTPEDWLVVEDTTFIPVFDDVSRKMLDAQRAFLKKDNKSAAAAVRQSAADLSSESSGASVEGQRRIQAASNDLGHLAAELDSNKIRSVKQLDAVFLKAHGADIDQRWVAADETIWYPYINEPDQHFKNAHDAFASRDLKKSAEEIRKGESFVKLEDVRATGDAKRSLDASTRELDRLAGDVSKGGIKDVRSLDIAFARADYALALSHLAKASESSATNDASKTGYELKAAASYLEQGASRAGSEVESGVSASVHDAREAAGKLIQGTTVATGDIGNAIKSAGQGIDLLGKKVMQAKP